MKYKITNSVPDVPENKSPNTGNSSAVFMEWRSGSSFKWFSLILLCVNLLLMTIMVFLFSNNAIFSNKNNVCLTEDCINAASSVLSAMDRNTDPCIDFYQYACGGWLRSNPVPDSTASWDRLALLRESLMHKMRRLLERDDDGGGSGGGGGGSGDSLNSTGVRKAKVLFKACMNTDSIEAEGLAPIQNVLATLGLPITPPMADSDYQFDWLFTVAKTRRLLGVGFLVGMSVVEDVRNSLVNKIVIEQVSHGFGERFLLDRKKFASEIQSYKKYIIQMLRAYANFTDAPEFAEDIIDFSSKIANVMTPAEVRRSPNHLFHEVNLLELSKGPGLPSWKFINWTHYIETVFSDTSIELNPKSDTIILLDLPYLKKLSMLIQKEQNTLPLQRFLWWNIFSTLAPLTLARFRTLGFEFSQRLLGVETRAPRWKVCTSNVNANFGLALSYLYVRSHVDKLQKNKALGMIEDIRDAFERGVDELEWMDEATREKLLTKLHAIRAFVGYPGWIMNTTLLDMHYSNANVFEEDMFGTFLNLTNVSVRRNLESIRRSPDRNRWVASATTVNAFYSAALNSVTFPAGILNPPFYGNGIAAIDYGAIGAIMGHEITHGFDDQGRRYDENGNLKQWWTGTTLAHYHSRAKCIIEQYNKYSMPDLGEAFHVHGYNTLGENIADNGGLRAAFEGYKRRIKLSGSTDQRLPGLSDISPDQLFFLGFAQIWCGNSTLGALKSKLAAGAHSPNRIRVLGSLSNSKEFAQSWNCPYGRPMNPKDKCVLW